MDLKHFTKCLSSLIYPPTQESPFRQSQVQMIRPRLIFMQEKKKFISKNKIILICVFLVFPFWVRFGKYGMVWNGGCHSTLQPQAPG